MIGHQIAETVIRVDRRMTYTAVNAILTEPEAHPELLEEYHELVPMFRQMQELSALIRSCRKERGAIDFEFPESKVILDAEGTGGDPPVSVERGNTDDRGLHADGERDRGRGILHTRNPVLIPDA